MTIRHVEPGSGLSAQSINDVAINIKLQTSYSANAPWLVLVHSLGCDLRIWDAVSAYLQPHFHLIRYDIRGHGLSELGESGADIEQHADDLIRIIEEADVSNVFVCGLSIGGIIAFAAALKRPDLIRGLILSDTQARIGTAERYQERIERIEKGGIETIADEQMERWFSKEFRNNAPLQVALMRQMLVRQSLYGYLASVTALRDADYSSRIHEISCPTLCLAGSEDRSTPPEQVRILADGIDRSVLKLIDGAGHLPCLEAPDVMAKMILEFIEENMQ